MTKYAVEGTELTAIADAIRSVNGETTKYTTSEMPAAIRAGGGSGDSGVNIETCQLTVSGSNSNYYPTNIAYTTVNNNGSMEHINETVSGSSVTVTCLRNSVVAVMFKSTLNITSTSDVSNNLLFHSGTLAVFKVGDYETLNLKNSSSHSGGSIA